MTRLPLLFLPLLALAACKKDEGDDSPTETPVVAIAQPVDGTLYPHGEDIPLEVTATVGDRPAEIVRATWTVGDRQINGETGVVSDLDPGHYVVSVEVIVDDKTLTDSVEIDVDTPLDTGDSGDTDSGDTDSGDTDTDTGTPPAWSYVGSITATVEYHGTYGDYEDDCPGQVRFTIGKDRVLTGSGSCNAFDTDFPFVLSGEVRGGSWDCVLAMEFGGETAETPCVGSGAAGDPLSATFDKTHVYGSDRVRIAGSWSAIPQ